MTYERRVGNRSISARAEQDVLVLPRRGACAQNPTGVLAELAAGYVLTQEGKVLPKTRRPFNALMAPGPWRGITAALAVGLLLALAERLVAPGQVHAGDPDWILALVLGFGAVAVFDRLSSRSAATREAARPRTKAPDESRVWTPLEPWGYVREGPVICAVRWGGPGEPPAVDEPLPDPPEDAFEHPTAAAPAQDSTTATTKTRRKVVST